MLSRIVEFLKTDIWRIRLKKYPPGKSYFIKQLRVFLLALRGFDENKCIFRASALTFYSLLSIVPVIAMMFGIAKGFGLEERLETEIMQRMQNQKEAAEKIVNFAHSLLDNTSGGVIAGIGVIFLLWSIIKVLGNIENSFNDIWGIKTPRSFARKFSDYVSMFLICPFLLIISSSATVIISSRIQDIIHRFSFFNSFGFLIMFVLRLLPYGTIWLLFTFVFIFMPNTKVRFRSGLMGGIIAGTLFQIVQWVYIAFQIRVTNYNAIYGSFAALPLFLLWMQISWLVVLFGAELSFAHQNVETYEFEPDCLTASYSFRKLLSLWITERLVKNFHNAQAPMNAEKISHTLEIPIRLVRQILYDLVEARVLSEVRIRPGKDYAYQPAVDIDKITVKFAIDALEQHGVSAIPIEKTKELEKLSECLNLFSDAVGKSSGNILLKDMNNYISNA